MSKTVEEFISENVETSVWLDKAEKRRKLMLDKMDNGEGLLLDYNFITGKIGNILSAASFYPMFAGLACNI